MEIVNRSVDIKIYKCYKQKTWIRVTSMMLINVVLNQSQLPGAGTGLFVKNRVREGEVIYKFDPHKSTIIPINEFYTKDPDTQARLLHNGSVDFSIPNNPAVVIDSDPQCFFLNETWEEERANWKWFIPNGENWEETIGIVTRDIVPGEELLYYPPECMTLVHLDCATKNKGYLRHLQDLNWRVEMLTRTLRMQRHNANVWGACWVRYWTQLACAANDTRECKM